MKTQQQKKDIIDSCLSITSLLADKTYQFENWATSESEKGIDYDETTCRFFDLLEPVLDEYTEFDFTETQYKLLKKLYMQFDAFSEEHNSPREFIDTPEWNEIVELAKQVLDAFHYKG